MHLKILLSTCMFFVACTERDVLNIEPNIMLTSPNNSFVARAYIDMWGGSAGGVDYVITIQSESEQADISKNIIFKTSKEGEICMDWIDEENIKISTLISKKITIKEKSIRLNNKNIQIGYSSKMNSSTCMGVQGFEAKRI
ncbi:MAG TPA: hypothetical protein EYG94_08565 [Campylobacterales bacterium]|nr:hypothetical protein [Campylobacterales bacterium]